MEPVNAALELSEMQILNDPITETEVLNPIGKLKNTRQPGYDNI